MLNICLRYLILTKKMNQVFTGGALWTFIQRTIKRKDQLTEAAQNFLHLLEQFAKLKKNSMHEFTHFRKYYSRINICNLWSISVIFL